MEDVQSYAPPRLHGFGLAEIDPVPEAEQSDLWRMLIASPPLADVEFIFAQVIAHMIDEP